VRERERESEGERERDVVGSHGRCWKGPGLEIGTIRDQVKPFQLNTLPAMHATQCYVRLGVLVAARRRR
jgi:hypothetical protein